MNYSKLLQILKSRTFWTILAIFLFNGLQAIQPEVSGDLQVFINSVLSLVAVYFKAFPSQNYSE